MILISVFLLITIYISSLIISDSLLIEKLKINDNERHFTGGELVQVFEISLTTSSVGKINL